jgi:cytochrome c biogenesis protein CcdA
MIFNAIAKISKKTALIMLFYLLGLVLIFHFLIYFEQIPYDKVWAGKLKSFEEMRAFETFSIVLNIFMLSILSIKYKLLEKNKTNRVIDLFILIFEY